MKTDRLEDFVNAHREDFDMHEPSPKVWEQIAASQKKVKTVRVNTLLIRIAAVVVFAVLLSVLVIKSGLIRQHELAGLSPDPELQELMEAEAYYAQEVDLKIREIRKCYQTNPELKTEVESDLNELQEMYDTLRKDLRENIARKTVIEAMIENNRIRLKLVDQVLSQINC